MARKSRKRKFAACGGILGASYLLANHCACGAPDFVKGLAVGLGVALLTLSLLPEEKLAWLEARKPWKRRG